MAAAASGNLGDMLGIVSSSEVGKVLGYANSLATTVSTAIALISNPSALGWKIMSALGLSGLATSVAAWSGIVRSISRVGSSSSLSAPATPLVYTPSRQQAYVNACAVAALGRQALIAQAVGASSLVGTRVDSPRAGLTQGIAVVGTASASAQPLISYTDMVAVRDELIGVIDQESLTASDKVYHALMKARAAVWNDLTLRARENARLSTLTPTEVLPALVLAYDYYEDATRDTDIVARNAIRHPGFVPVATLKVLTR